MQPFKVGQKVVALIGEKNKHRIVKGDIYTVIGMKSFCNCQPCVIDIGQKTEMIYNHCDTCHLEDVETNGIKWFCSTYFAPIDELKERIRYVAVSETLREQAVEVAAIETN